MPLSLPGYKYVWYISSLPPLQWPRRHRQEDSAFRNCFAWETLYSPVDRSISIVLLSSLFPALCRSPDRSIKAAYAQNSASGIIAIFPALAPFCDPKLEAICPRQQEQPGPYCLCLCSTYSSKMRFHRCFLFSYSLYRVHLGGLPGRIHSGHKVYQKGEEHGVNEELRPHDYRHF